jgi:hypothetical protein
MDVMMRLAAGDLTVRGAARELEVSIGTIQKYRREIVVGESEAACS